MLKDENFHILHFYLKEEAAGTAGVDTIAEDTDTDPPDLSKYGIPYFIFL